MSHVRVGGTLPSMLWIKRPEKFRVCRAGHGPFNIGFRPPATRPMVQGHPSSKSSKGPPFLDAGGSLVPRKH